MNVRDLARALGLALALVHPAHADDDLDSLFEELEDQPAPELEEPSEAALLGGRWWRLSGGVALETAFNFDQDRSQYEGLAKLRTEGRLQLDLRLPAQLAASAPPPLADWKLRFGGRGWWDFAYLIQGRDHFTRAVLDSYEAELEVWESWVGGPVTDWLEVRAGRELVSFGTSESLRVVDVLWPIDNREPGAADLDDLLLPELHARADVVTPRWSLTGMAILERRFSEQPPSGSSFLPAGAILPPVDEPSNAIDNTELVLAARGRAGAVDLGLIGAWYYDDMPTSQFDAAVPGGVRRFHDRLWMVGATSVGAVGSWVLRGELAGFYGLTFANDPGEEHYRLDALAGVDYYGFTRTAIAVDVVHRWIPDAPASIEDAPDFAQRSLAQYAVRVRRDFLRDRLHLTLVGLGFGVDLSEGGILRLQGDYEWNDLLTLTLGVLLYESGDSLPVSALGSNDRVFLNALVRF